MSIECKDCYTLKIMIVNVESKFFWFERYPAKSRGGVAITTGKVRDFLLDFGHSKGENASRVGD